jgi:hypothetical protein
MQTLTSSAFAVVPDAVETKKLSLAPTPDFSRGMDASYIQPMQSNQDIREEDVEKVIPKDLTPTSSTSEVASKIIDHSVSSYLNSPTVKNSSLGQATTKIDKSMSGNMSVGGSDPASIQHNFKFEMQAAQTKAVMAYTGYTNAEITYKASESTLDLQVHEKVAMLGTQLVYNHTIKPADTRDIVSLKWVW